MFKKIYNMAVFQVEIEPIALLIKASDTHDPTSPDMSFVRMPSSGGTYVLYLPGSSIKGVIRSFSEALLKTIKVSNVPQVCDGSNANTMCPKKNKGSNEDKLSYKKHCLVCRTFGSQDIASRVEFSDFLPAPDVKSELFKYLTVRPGVSINRATGAVRHGPFDMEVLTGGRFLGTVSFTNYQLWQIGLVLTVFDLMNKGMVKIGYAKSRGLGDVRVSIKRMIFRQLGVLKNDDNAPVNAVNIKGIGQVNDENFVDEYGLIRYDGDIIKVVSEDLRVNNNRFWTEIAVHVESTGKFKELFVEHFANVFGGKL